LTAPTDHHPTPKEIMQTPPLPGLIGWMNGAKAAKVESPHGLTDVELQEDQMNVDWLHSLMGDLNQKECNRHEEQQKPLVMRLHWAGPSRASAAPDLHFHPMPGLTDVMCKVMQRTGQASVYTCFFDGEEAVVKVYPEFGRPQFDLERNALEYVFIASLLCALSLSLSLSHAHTHTHTHTHTHARTTRVSGGAWWSELVVVDCGVVGCLVGRLQGDRPS
jgi:hypothetical protein